MANNLLICPCKLNSHKVLLYDNQEQNKIHPKICSQTYKVLNNNILKCNKTAWNIKFDKYNMLKNRLNGSAPI